MATMDYSSFAPFSYAEGLWLASMPNPDQLAVGHAAMARGDVSSSSASCPSGTLRLSYFTAVRNETVTQVRTLTGGTAAAATPTLCRVGLFKVEANNDLTLVASTANDTTLWAATSTRYLTPFSVPYTLQKGTRYAVGILCVSAVATPTFMGNNVMLGAEAFEEPKMNANFATADLPATIPNGSLTAVATRLYSVVLP